MLRFAGCALVLLAAACGGDDGEAPDAGPVHIVRVVAEESGAPLVRASVTIDGDFMGETDEAGQLVVELPGELVNIRVVPPGRAVGLFVGAPPTGDLVIPAADPSTTPARVAGTALGW